MRGFVSTPLVIGVVILIVIIGGVIFYQGKTVTETKPSPTPLVIQTDQQPATAATPSATAKANATSKPTSKPSIMPSATFTPRSTSAPTPTPTPVPVAAPKTGCAEYDMGATLGNI